MHRRNTVFWAQGQVTKNSPQGVQVVQTHKSTHKININPSSSCHGSCPTLSHSEQTNLLWLLNRACRFVSHPHMYPSKKVSFNMWKDQKQRQGSGGLLKKHWKLQSAELICKIPLSYSNRCLHYLRGSRSCNLLKHTSLVLQRPWCKSCDSIAAGCWSSTLKKERPWTESCSRGVCAECSVRLNLKTVGDWAAHTNFWEIICNRDLLQVE